MSHSDITHGAAIRALAGMLEAAKHEATHGNWPSTMTLRAMIRAEQVLAATANATPAEVYCHLKQAKAAAKAKLKAGKEVVS